MNHVDSTVTLLCPQRTDEDILREHPWGLWEGCDGNWYTYMTASDGSRSLKKRDSYEKLSAYVIRHYRKQEKEPTIHYIADKWLAEVEKNSPLPPAKRGLYESIINRFFHEIGNRNIRQFSRNEARDFVTEITSRNLSRQSLANFYTVTGGIFNYAHRNHLISYVFEDLFSHSGRPTNTPVVFNEFQVKTLVSYLRTNYRDLIDLAWLLHFYANGLRPGELTGLSPRDVKRNGLHIHQILDIRMPMVPVLIPLDADHPQARTVPLKESQYWLLREVHRMRSEGDFFFQLPNGPVTWQMMLDRMDEIDKRLKLSIDWQRQGPNQTSCHTPTRRRRTASDRSHIRIVR